MQSNTNKFYILFVGRCSNYLLKEYFIKYFKMKIPLAIIIVAYKSERMTIDFIKNQLCKVKIPHTIIIVNNGATDISNLQYKSSLSAQIIMDSNTDAVDLATKIYVINNQQNSGFAKGNNIGYRFAQKYFNPEFILFTNNDIRFVDDNVVEKLINKLKEHTDAGIIGPMVRGIDGDYQSPATFISFADKYIWMYLFSPFLNKKKKTEYFKKDYAKKAKEGYHYWVMGSFFIVVSKDYKECGMMDENTFLYAEEMILAERMAKIEKKVYYDPEVCVIHFHGATTGKNINYRKLRDLQFESDVYYYRHYLHISNFEILIGRLVKHIVYLLKNIK